MLDKNVLSSLQETIKKDIPSFEVVYKDGSFLMRVLALLMSPFNPGFMSKYITTWGTKVYFPSEKFFLENPANSFRILAHEYVHLWDSKEHSTFKLSYLFPQVLAILPLLGFMILAGPHCWIAALPVVSYVLACLAGKLTKVLFWVMLVLLLAGTAVLAWMLTGWASLVLLGVLLFLGPWPAPWRVKWELRGYGMNGAIAQWVYGDFTDAYRDAILPQFVGPAYFCMSWSRMKVVASLNDFWQRAKSGELQKEQPYGRVFDLLNKG
jgi:hypothetical protein